MRSKSKKRQAKAAKEMQPPVMAQERAALPRLLSAKEIEATIGIRAESLYKMVRAGVCPCVRRGVKKRGILFDAEEVLRALRQPISNTNQPETMLATARG